MIKLTDSVDSQVRQALRSGFRIAAFTASFILIAGCSTFSNGGPCKSTSSSLGTSEFQVDITTYSSKSPGARAVIVLPPTGGTNRIDRSYSFKLCKAGFDVTIMNSWTGDSGTSTDLEIHEGFYSRMLTAFELTLTSIEAPYVGVLGTSLGGLYAAVAAAKFERLDGVFLIATGAPIVDVIVNSDQEAMRKLAETRRTRFGIVDDQDYTSKLAGKFTLEPMSQPPLQKKKDFGMVIAEEDTTVPTYYQRLLRDYLRPRIEISLKNAHFWAIVNTWLYHDDDIVEFFLESSKS